MVAGYIRKRLLYCPGRAGGTAKTDKCALGFSDGIGNGAFGLGQVITRAEFASFICKVEGFGGNAAQAYTDNTDKVSRAQPKPVLSN